MSATHDRLGKRLCDGQVITWTHSNGTRAPLNLGWIKDIADNGVIWVEKVEEEYGLYTDPTTRQRQYKALGYNWLVSICRAQGDHITVVPGLSKYDLYDRYPALAPSIKEGTHER